MKMVLSFMICVLAGVGGVAMKAPAKQPAESIERLDPAVDKIIPSGAQVEKLVTCCIWSEGPIWIHSGFVLFADIPNNRIMKWTPAGKLAVFLQPSGYTGAAKYNGPEPGSNGMTLDRKGRLTVAGHAARNVYRLESLANGAKMTILAASYEGKRFSSPNDLVYRSDGSLYFTDPPYGLQTQSDTDPQKELPFNGVFRILNATSQKPGAPPDDARVQLIIRDLTRPNGIAFSPDEKYLYIANSDPDHKVWIRYPVHPDGSVGKGELFCDAMPDKREGSPDGIKVDRQGNLYGSGPGGIWIISPQGKHVGTILLPERAANLNWGGADGRTLYITASTSLYRIHLNISGVRP